MLVRKGGLFFEADARLAEKFSEAGFGVHDAGKLLLHPLEAGYLLKTGKASFNGGFRKFLLSQKKRDGSFPFCLEAYSQIRGTGRIIRPYLQSKKRFRVYAPGIGREEDRPSILVCLLPGKAPSAKSLAREVKIAHRARLDLVVACGSKSKIRYYKISSFNF
ncbi:MAG: hypothetical protein N3E51_00500 [Candidatus Micrarchaeota archaeon]|nr:hypothetical protein [Candidatus Micrarchaeota archaeon]